MFPTNDTVRKAFEANLSLGQAMSAATMDFQTAAALNTQKQFNSAFDGFRGMMELSQKTTRAMQQSVADHVVSAMVEPAV